MSDLFGWLPGPGQTILFFFLALFPLVLIHELGHFLVAKANRVRVDEFGIGFPPRLLRLFSFGGTDYTVNVLPLGGFVRLAGEDDPDVPGAFAGMPKRVRAAVLFAGPAANFLLAAVLLAGLGMAYGIRTPMPEGGGLVLVTQVLAGQPGAEAGLEPGDLIYAVGGQRLADLPAEGGEPTEPAPIRALKAATDASTDQALAVAVLRGLEPIAAVPPATGLRSEPVDLPLLDAERVLEAPPDSGLRPGDLVLAALVAEAGPLVLRPLGEAAEGSAYVQSLEIVPRRSAPGEPGRIGIGIDGLYATESMGVARALWYGPQQAALLSVAMVQGLIDMITRTIEPAIAGPVGIAQMSKQAGERGLETFLFFMAILSINLAIINLLPIPALDGGRLLFILVEALRGRRVEPNREAVVHMIGMALVLGLMLVITVWEVARFTGVGSP